MPELWRDVIDYEGLYQVSNLGQLRSRDRIVQYVCNGQSITRTYKGRKKRLQISPSGYLQVTLSKEGRQRTFRVHKIVALAWLGSRPLQHVIRHGPDGQLDNSVSNLCYGTKTEDAYDRRRDGTHRGRCVRRSDGVEFASLRLAEEASGCDFRNIWAVCNDKRKTAGGFGWEYI